MLMQVWHMPGLIGPTNSETLLASVVASAAYKDKSLPDVSLPVQQGMGAVDLSDPLDPFLFWPEVKICYLPHYHYMSRVVLPQESLLEWYFSDSLLIAMGRLHSWVDCLRPISKSWLRKGQAPLITWSLRAGCTRVRLPYWHDWSWWFWLVFILPSQHVQQAEKTPLSQAFYKWKSSCLQAKNRKRAAKPSHPLIVWKLGTLILNVFDFASLQISFEREVEI